MSAVFCKNHLDRRALYQCENCDGMWCDRCVEPSHRLLLCPACGERAVPIVADAGATTPEVVRRAKQTAHYDFADALGYPFRGLGIYLFGGYVAYMTVVGWLPLGCLFYLLLLVILPGLLLEIVRTTAEGDIELPDWPDFMDFDERFSEWFGVFITVVVAALPLALLLRVYGCGAWRLASGQWDLPCWGMLLIGLMVGVAVWVPAFGAFGVYRSTWLGLRLDLHFRALGIFGARGLTTVGLVAGLHFASNLVQAALAFIPLLGTIAGAAVGGYALFLAPHLIGLLFRRHSDAMDAVYWK